MEAIGLISHLQDTDLVITGEGKTTCGKTPVNVSCHAKEESCCHRYRRVPGIWAWTGSLQGIDLVFPIIATYYRPWSCITHWICNIQCTTRNVTSLLAFVWQAWQIIDSTRWFNAIAGQSFLWLIKWESANLKTLFNLYNADPKHYCEKRLINYHKSSYFLSHQDRHTAPTIQCCNDVQA